MTTNPTCETITLDLPAYARNLLDASVALPIERHLRMCQSCRMELGELQGLELLFENHMPTITPSPTFASTFANRLAAEILAEERATGRGLFGWRIRPWAIPVGIAATVAIGVVALSLVTSRTNPVDRNGATTVAVAPSGDSRVAPAAPAEKGATVASKATSGGRADVVAAPPPELLERPDLFVDYSVIRELDLLENTERAG